MGYFPFLPVNMYMKITSEDIAWGKRSLNDIAGKKETENSLNNYNQIKGRKN